MAKTFASWDSYSDFERAVRSQNRYFFDRESKSFLSSVAKSCEKRIKKIAAGKIIWRAQLGHAWKKVKHLGLEYEEPDPFPPERMKPLSHSAHEGRVNPRGIPCLYGSNIMQTAVAEIRPGVGALVSIARMRAIRELRLVDCGGDPDIEHEIWFEAPPAKDREEIVWRAIGRAFSTPASFNAGIAEYAPTQVLAEHFRQLKYDGVLFRSSLGEGFNVALFDLKVAEVVEIMLVPVTGVRYTVGKPNSLHIKKHINKK